jgi:hypothetical protein
MTLRVSHSPWPTLVVQVMTPTAGGVVARSD